jgi:hypothetical protein
LINNKIIKEYLLVEGGNGSEVGLKLRLKRKGLCGVLAIYLLVLVVEEEDEIVNTVAEEEEEERIIFFGGGGGVIKLLKYKKRERRKVCVDLILLF